MLRPNRHSLTMTAISLIAAILLGSGCATTSPPPSQTYNSELEYLKSLHQAGPVTEPQLAPLLDAAVHECQPAARRHRVLRILPTKAWRAAFSRRSQNKQL